MSMKNKEVLKYLNLARQYPKYYVGLIDQQLNSFVDQFNIKLGEDVLYQTIEGKTLWEQAKKFLLNQQPLRPLDFHEGLAKAASDHSKDIVKNKSNGHTGSDGSTFIERIQRYCTKGKGSMIQLLGTTHKIPGKNSIELGILNFIIDDGVTNRGHRRALFNKDYRYVGLEFCEYEDKIYSVVTITQTNLQLITNFQCSVGTSMGNLANLSQQISQIKNVQSIPQKQNSIIDIPQKNKKESVIVENKKQKKSNLQSQKSIKRTSNNVIQSQKNSSEWTFKNVDNNSKIVDKKQFSFKPQQQPSIFKQVDQSFQSVCSNKNQVKGSFMKPRKQCKQNMISDKNIDNKPSKQSSKLISNNSSNSLPKQLSTISVSQYPSKNKSTPSQGYGFSSNVQPFKEKSKINSVFSKSNCSSNGFGTGFSKKIVQKNEKIRNWSEDGFDVKQTVTLIKFEDGTVQNFIQKHSILKDSSNSIHSHQ